MKSEQKSKIGKSVNELYLSDEYILKNPSLHEEDSLWKVSKITPLASIYIKYINEVKINMLDIGGGAGLILKEVSSYFLKSHGLKVNKFVLDLSPGMLEIQKKANPDLIKSLNEDICKTSLGNKEIDLTLMIDVLEHVHNPIDALEEVMRISNFVILKVPLEDNLDNRFWNFVTRGKQRQKLIKDIGHINIYNLDKLKYQIEEHLGQILDIYFTNVFLYYRNSESYKNMQIKSKLANFVRLSLFKISPKLCSSIFNDYVMVLVKCY